jgi:DNA-binding HxlR family transcriptional regulator
MALFDLLGRRWAMGVLWALNKEGPCSFRQLQLLCGSVSPTVLNTRLKELRQASLVERSEQGYRSTAEGTRLYQLLVPLGAWAKDWARGRD